MPPHLAQYGFEMHFIFLMAAVDVKHLHIFIGLRKVCVRVGGLRTALWSQFLCLYGSFKGQIYVARCLW